MLYFIELGLFGGEVDNINNKVSKNKGNEYVDGCDESVSWCEEIFDFLNDFHDYGILYLALFFIYRYSWGDGD